MAEKGDINYAKAFSVSAALFLLAIGAKGYGFFLIIGILLFSGVFIYFDVRQVVAFAASFRRASAIESVADDVKLSKASKSFFLTGIAESLLMIILMAAIAGLVIDGVLTKKSLDEVLSIALQIGNLGYIFTLLGTLFVATAAHHFLKSYLAKDFSFINILYSFKVGFIGFSGLLCLAFGIFILIGS